MGLLLDLDAFYLEHRRCGQLDTGIEEGRVWMTCGCGAWLVRPVGHPGPHAGGRSCPQRYTDRNGIGVDTSI
jgi:hypothetical protein